MQCQQPAHVAFGPGGTTVIFLSCRCGLRPPLCLRQRLGGNTIDPATKAHSFGEGGYRGRKPGRHDGRLADPLRAAERSLSCKLIVSRQLVSVSHLRTMVRNVELHGELCAQRRTQDLHIVSEGPNQDEPPPALGWGGRGWGMDPAPRVADRRGQGIGVR
jgi:hypothetical protein